MLCDEGEHERRLRHDRIGSYTDSLSSGNQVHEGVSRVAGAARPPRGVDHHKEPGLAGLRGDEGRGGLALGVLPALPMGWSWALWLMQRVHLNPVNRPGFLDGQVALSGWPFPSLARGHVRSHIAATSPWSGSDGDSARDARDSVLQEIEWAGFTMHETTSVEEESRVLDGDLGGSTVKVRRDIRKLWLVKNAFEWLEPGPLAGSRWRCSSGTSFFKRSGMSDQRAMHTCTRDRYWQPMRVWDTLLRELVHLRGVPSPRHSPRLGPLREGHGHGRFPACARLCGPSGRSAASQLRRRSGASDDWGPPGPRRWPSRAGRPRARRRRRSGVPGRRGGGGGSRSGLAHSCLGGAMRRWRIQTRKDPWRLGQRNQSRV